MNANRTEDDADKRRGDQSWKGLDTRRQNATSQTTPHTVLMPEEPGTVEGALAAMEVITRKFDPYADPRIRFP